MAKQTLAVKYRPQKFNDVVEQNVIKAILQNQINDNDIKNCYLFCGPAGCGKAQPLYSKVLTTNGFITMGNVKFGTEVITRKGNKAKVIAVYPQGERDIYEISFSDRTSIRVSDNHLNSVFRYNQDKKVREDFVIETKDLIELFNKTRFKLRVDLPIVDFEEQDVPLDPYLLGCLIGDGGLHGSGNDFSNSEKDVVEKVDSLLHKIDCKLNLKKGSTKDYDITSTTDSFKYFFTYNGIEYKGSRGVIEQLVIDGYPKFDTETILRLSDNTAKQILKKYPELTGKISAKVNDNYSQVNSLNRIIEYLGLSKKSTEKFIPKCYLINSRDTRQQLLMGLFDTDGYTDKGGQTVFATSSKQLSDDFSFLVRSLGCRDTVTVSESSYVNSDGERVDCNLSYSHYIKFPNDFEYCSSKKHLERRKRRQNEPIKNIVNIKYIGKEECQCIYVDDEDHTYITDAFTPTHNTTDARLFAKEINGNTANITELDAASHNGVDDVRKLIEDSKFKPIGSKYRVYIIDECFSGDTLVRTEKGNIKIKDIHAGDVVYNISGKTVVKNVFKNTIDKDRLICVKVNSKNIITTCDHLFFTDRGWTEAKNLRSGDVLFDYKELCYLWERFPMLSERYQENLFCRLYETITRTNTEITLCEKVNNKNLSDMSETVSNISFCEFNNLWNILCKSLCETEGNDTEAVRYLQQESLRISVSCMWENFSGENKEKSEILFLRMLQSGKIRNFEKYSKKGKDYGVCLYYMWQNILCTWFKQKKDLLEGVFGNSYKSEQKSGSFKKMQGKNEIEQPVTKPREYRENETNKTKEWNITQVEWCSWWKRSLHRTSVEIAQRAWGDMDTRVCCSNENGKRQRISNELQTRPCLTRENDWCGSGWQEPFIEKFTVERCKESFSVRESRVESIEIYKRGYNDELFSSCFSDTESNGNIVTLYDLEIDGHNSYFVNDVLVHNCHALSSSAWQSFLKTMEEPTATSVFLLCTTDPQKIPATIISRIQRYDFQKITHAGIVNRLKYIISKENEEGCNYTYEEEAISYIAKLADGGMRDSITLLEKTLAYNPNITMESVTKALGTVDYTVMFDLTDSICKMDKKSVIEIIETIYRNGIDLKQFIKNYNYFVLDLCKYDILRNFDHLQIPSVYSNRMKYTKEDYAFFTTLLNEVINLNSNIKWEATPKPIIESTFILLCSEA